jgi:hypothetical protein
MSAQEEGTVKLKVYLGDDVYAEYEPVDSSIRLTRANSLDANPFVVISLDIGVLDCFDKFRAEILKAETEAANAKFQEAWNVKEMSE